MSFLPCDLLTALATVPRSLALTARGEQFAAIIHVLLPTLGTHFRSVALELAPGAPTPEVVRSVQPRPALTSVHACVDVVNKHLLLGLDGLSGAHSNARFAPIDAVHYLSVIGARVIQTRVQGKQPREFRFRWVSWYIPQQMLQFGVVLDAVGEILQGTSKI